MNHFIRSFFAASLLIAGIFFGGCGGSDDGDSSSSGTLSLSMTDAPLIDENVTGVYIKVTGIEYHHDGNWESADDFIAPETFNLLDLTNGKTIDLGDLVLPAGEYTQLRFLLDAPEDSSAKTDSACQLEFNGDYNVSLYVPSDSQTGFKSTGNFTIEANAQISVTADFDVRKSIVSAGNSGKYLLKPTIRLVVNEHSGEINGTVTDLPEASEVVVYAYLDDTYDNDFEPDSDSIRFSQSVTSNDVNLSDGSFTLAFLAEGTYDLVFASYESSQFSSVLGSREDVNVTKAQTITLDINASTLNPL